MTDMTHKELKATANLTQAYLLTYLLLLPSLPTAAADWAGTVSLLKTSTNSGAILFQLSGKAKSTVRCNENNMYAITLGSPGGQAMFDLLKYAYINKLPVEANSLGTCSVYWKAESAKDIVLKR